MRRRAKVSNINPEGDASRFVSKDGSPIKRGLPPPQPNGTAQMTPLINIGHLPGKEPRPLESGNSDIDDSDDDNKNPASGDEIDDHVDDDEESDGSELEDAEGDDDNVIDDDEEMRDIGRDSDVDETEDELEVNNAGRPPPTDEEVSDNDTDDSDEDDSDDEIERRPWDFVSGKIAASTLGQNVKRPVAVGGSRENSPVTKERQGGEADDDVDEEASDSDSSSSSSSSSNSDLDSDGEGGSDVEDLENITTSIQEEESSESENDSDPESDLDYIDDDADDDDDDDDANNNSVEVKIFQEHTKTASSSSIREAGATRDDISMEDIQDIINDSSTPIKDDDLDDVSSDAEDIVSALEGIADEEMSYEEVDELLSNSFEFDYWDQRILSEAVKLLSTAKETNDDLVHSRLPVRIPSPGDLSFWVDKMLPAVASPSPIVQSLKEKEELRSYASRKIHEMFNAQLSALDLSHVNLPVEGTSAPNKESSPLLKGQLFVGSFSAAESRLALAALQVKNVIQLSCHPLDELWVGDGVKYSTNILPGCESKENGATVKVITESMFQVSATINGPGKHMAGGECSVLVVCSTGDEHSAVTCALFLMQSLGMDQDAAVKYMMEIRPSSNIDCSLLAAAHAYAETLRKNISPPCPKRMLSSQMLSAMLKNKDDSPKRQRVQFSNSSNDLGVSADSQAAPGTTPLPPLPLFSLGEPAHSSFRMRTDDREISSSDEDYEVETDRQLGEELKGKGSDNEQSEPVPLLTPPASPLVFHGDQGDTTVCEWPSNLAVDSAYSSAIAETRPLSPVSLQKQEEEEEKRILLSPKLTQKNLPIDPTTGLTPMIRGISVDFKNESSTRKAQ